MIGTLAARRSSVDGNRGVGTKATRWCLLGEGEDVEPGAKPHFRGSGEPSERSENVERGWEPHPCLG